MKTTFSLLTALLAPAAALTAQQASAPGKALTKRVAFAQSCFWTGEMKLGQIEGVVRTEAGFIGGREVTLVEYASEQLALEELARRAKQAGVADLVHLEADAARSVAGVVAGPPLDQTYRTAPASDQKKQIQGTPFAKLPLSAAQATKVNAFARQNPAKASEWLTPAQREQIKGAR